MNYNTRISNITSKNSIPTSALAEVMNYYGHPAAARLTNAFPEDTEWTLSKIRKIESQWTAIPSYEFEAFTTVCGIKTDIRCYHDGSTVNFFGITTESEVQFIHNADGHCYLCDSEGSCDMISEFEIDLHYLDMISAIESVLWENRLYTNAYGSLIPFNRFHIGTANNHVTATHGSWWRKSTHIVSDKKHANGYREITTASGTVYYLYTV